MSDSDALGEQLGSDGIRVYSKFKYLFILMMLVDCTWALGHSALTNYTPCAQLTQ